MGSGKNRKKANARFWDIVHGSPVKLTIGPGKTIHHYEFERTDEGWTARDTTWTHEPRRVVRTVAERTLDCDGRYDRAWAAEAETRGWQLRAVWPSEEIDAAHPDIPGFPRWRAIEETQRDYSAEAAGY